MSSDSPPRGCWIFPFLVLASLVFVGSAAPREAPVPAPSAPMAQPAIGGLAAVPGPLGAPQNVRADGSGEARSKRSDAGGTSPATESGAPSASIGTALYSGLATWFPASGYQGAVPWWKPGQAPLVVAVSAFRDGRTYSTSVLVTGWCACHERGGIPTVIDLSPRAFAELAPLSAGVVSVQVELPTQGPRLPQTDK